MVEAGGILGEIVARKRADLAQRYANGAAHGRATPTRRRLSHALRRPGARFVLEVKRASPSEGALRANADPAKIAQAYASVADAISVLTDGPYFGGSLDDLARVRAVFDGSILAKDFVVDPRQVAEARAFGADAVLVMLSVLDDEAARSILAEAERWGMDALVEVHDEAEARRAVALGAPLIGVNNRDLRTLKVDLAVTERLAPLVPRNRVLVAESGITSRSDVERLSPHADAFLVGSALMRAASPGRAARVLAFGRVKVCGLTRVEDVRAAVHAGASYAGVILAAGSPRCVTEEAAATLVHAAQNQDLAAALVFRDNPLERVSALAQRVRPDAIQLHGGESAEYIARLREALDPATEIWAACPVENTPPAPRAGADRIVYDSTAGGQSGGTGRVFDWDLIAAQPDRASALLAGGLTPANARAASHVGAFTLDVSSGVEAAPGRKDPAKLAAFFAALRPAARAGARSC